MRALRDGRFDEIASVVRGSMRVVDWSEIDAGLPPPDAVHPNAVTWDGAVDGVAVAARLVAVSRFGDALQYLRDAEPFVEQGSPLARALLQAAQGRCLHLLGEGQAALEAAEAATGLMATMGDPVLIAEASLQALRTRGLVKGENDVTDALRRSWEAFRVAEDRVGGADCLLEQALRELRDGRGDAASRSAKEAEETLADRSGWSALASEIAVARCMAASQSVNCTATTKLAKRLTGEYLLLSDPWWSWQIDCAVADAAIAADDRRAAAKPIRLSCRALERLRFRVGDVEQRAGWLMPRLRPFEHALDDALKKHRLQQVLEITERVARSALAHSLLARATQADPETSLQASRLLALSGAPSGSTGQELLDDAAERDGEVIAMLSRRHAVLAAMVRADAAVDVEALLNRAGGGSFLSLLETQHGVWRIWGSDRQVSGADYVPTGITYRRVLDRITDKNPARLDRWLCELGTAELLAELGTTLVPRDLLNMVSIDQQLTIVAGGRLSRVPYAALAASGALLVDRCNLSVVASLGLVAAIRVQPQSAVLAAPILLAPEPESLSGSVRQVRMLHGLWPDAVTAEGTAASLANLARLSDAGTLSQVRTLVVAGHGESHLFDPLRSGIRLGDGNILSAGTAMALRLPPQVEFWTCSSGSEPSNRGPEMSGLLASCLSAGSRRVLGSLWPLPDGDTADLAATVHSGLASGSSLAEGVGDAQRKLRNELPLLSWAGLIVSGLTDEAVNSSP
jgi:CHAT domain-containing protein